MGHIDLAAMLMKPAIPLGKHKRGQSGDLVGFVKRVWLLLFAEGGWWTSEEIRGELRLGRDTNVISALGEASRSGFIVRKRTKNIDGEQVVRFGVDTKCKVPRGVLLAEIEEMVRMGAKTKPVVYVKADHAIRGRPRPARVAVIAAGQLALFVE